MPKTILLVDDEPEILLLAGARLRANGYSVITAHNGEEALHAARIDFPDLVIIDVMIPPPDGCEVCRTLKADERLRTKPVLLFTAQKEEDAHALAMDCGADGHITKPFNSAALLNAIKHYIG